MHGNQTGRLGYVALVGLLLLLLTRGAPALAAQTNASADLRIGTGIAERELVGEAESFPADAGQLTAWTRITGAPDSVVEHVWRYEDHEWIVPLEVGSSSWRTWSRKIILPEWTGAWEVEVRDEAGNVLATARFTVSDTGS